MSNAIFSILLLFFLSVTAQSPSPSPSPSQSPSYSAHAPNSAPASAPLSSSPPTPSPASSPAPSPVNSPAPSPVESINHVGVDAEERGENSSRGGLSGSKKAGLAIGVIVAASVMVLAGMVYMKRKQNIRRSQYAYAARRGEFI